MKGPFTPLTLPFDEGLIDYRSFAINLSNASKKLGEFNTKMENTNLAFTYAINHLLKLESLYSTKIEGTQTTIDAVYEAEVDNSNEKSTDIKEVLRYNKALAMASKEVRNSPITIKLIKEIHKTLLSGNIRKNSNFIAGRFREQQNRVGEHIPPVSADVEKWMGNLERYINNDYGCDDNLPPVVKAALIHAQFETIHPFPDGNGRVGRVLIPIYLYKQDEINSPYFFLSQELERNSVRYYSYLQGTRALTKEGFSEWIKFFLDSIVNQTTRDIGFIDNINMLYEKVVKIMRSSINTNNTEIFVQEIFKNPIFTTDKIYKEIGINKNTIRSYIGVLEKEKILFRGQQKRNVRFYFMDLLDLLK